MPKRKPPPAYYAVRKAYPDVECKIKEGFAPCKPGIYAWRKGIWDEEVKLIAQGHSHPNIKFKVNGKEKGMNNCSGKGFSSKMAAEHWMETGCNCLGTNESCQEAIIEIGSKYRENMQIENENQSSVNFKHKTTDQEKKESKPSEHVELGTVQKQPIQTQNCGKNVMCFVDGVSAGDSGIGCYFPSHPNINRSNLICPISFLRTKIKLKTLEFKQFSDKDVATLEAIYQALTSAIENKIKSILIHTSSIKCTTHLKSARRISKHSVNDRLDSKILSLMTLTKVSFKISQSNSSSEMFKANAMAIEGAGSRPLKVSTPTKRSSDSSENSDDTETKKRSKLGSDFDTFADQSVDNGSSDDEYDAICTAEP